MRGNERKIILSRYNKCAYCGGTSLATEIDHCPPKQMFPKGQRPKGLEIPSCRGCNAGSKRCEAFGSLLAQIEVEQEFGEIKGGLEQLKKLLRHFQNNYPDLLRALEPTSAQVRDVSRLSTDQGRSYGALDLRAPVVRQELFKFGAKLGFALHWNERKAPLEMGQYVAVSAYSNVQAIRDEIPMGLFDLMPGSNTLAQGAKSARDRFVYSSRSMEDSSGTVHWVTFGQSICYFIFAGSGLDFSKDDEDRVFYPGCFKGT